MLRSNQEQPAQHLRSLGNCSLQSCFTEILLKVLFRLNLKSKFFAVNEDVQELVAAERIETIIPLTYLAIILMAYYGPNSEILGTIKMINWHYKGAIGDNITEFVTTISIFFAVDFLSFVINSISFAIFCKINVFKVIQKHQSKFWMYMAINEAYMFVEVRSWY